ncbi:MAG: 3-carboxy-cis,cis-muconate cycloisomerase [Alphaproteobacteria bacterium]|nr:3-carboxy-cis,cis-muconate cycloisomerase [Alphaproteobacteria bacterium]MBU1278428.1 3-carboxy-cis,cis-muconate cycloisomerase [Alphaproteobacteria bacterium]MBU1574866.1 3-carboxy-cis,cis-muconate cycloisomerase [Alphaproteobacteria bacterium]MBU1827939.1 3-carboxy-cis,cis-muconate cycloisomerase [Alphaproteobacteria bacterium]MBU2080205.1 3-carboxy-cis,cis-muconate cycloisomerase [Alphaproteobacteria bacterium]
MSSSVFDHPWLSGLFGDPEMAAILSPERQMAHMLAFEAAWSRACGTAGIFDPALAEEAARAIESATIDFADIAKGMAQDGVPIPRLIAQLKATAPAAALHKGATSQDVVDTALVLCLREASFLIAGRLMALETALKALEDRFGDAPLMGRTRMQAATEITVRDRVLTWRLPLADHLKTLDQSRENVEKVQIGGASGDRKALGDQADLVVSEVAKILGLAPIDKAWHSMRHGLTGYASFLSLITGSLGKIGQDIALMSQQGIEEISLSGGGGSSAMPHKQNPVAAELLVTLARFNATQVSAMHHAMIHEQDRSGAAWSLEWMVLPQMMMATGRALAMAITLINNIERIGTP